MLARGLTPVQVVLRVHSFRVIQRHRTLVQQEEGPRARMHGPRAKPWRHHLSDRCATSHPGSWVSSLSSSSRTCVAHIQIVRAASFPWTMRILGFMQLGVLLICNIFTARRFPRKENLAPLSLKHFRSAPFSLYCLSGFVALFGLYTVSH